MVSTAFLHKYTWSFDDCGTTFRTYFCTLITTFSLFCNRRFIWHCSAPSSPYVLLTQINTKILARSVPFIFIFYLYWDFIYVRWTWGSSHSFDTLVFTVWLRSEIHSSHPCVLFALPIWLPRSTSLAQSNVSKNRSGYPWVWRFRLLYPFCTL